MAGEANAYRMTIEELERALADSRRDVNAYAVLLRGEEEKTSFANRKAELAGSAVEDLRERVAELESKLKAVNPK